MSDEILVAQGLRKTYTLGHRQIEVLRGINLRVRRGEALVIRGASGAGKSTLLHLPGGLDAPTAGDVSSTARRYSDCRTCSGRDCATNGSDSYFSRTTPAGTRRVGKCLLTGAAARHW